MPTVHVRGVNLYYNTYGNGDPVILCHGFMDDCSVWETQIGILAERHTVIAYDQRGHGRSDKPSGDYSVQALAEDLNGLILGLDLGRVALVGHSLGGMASLVVALDYPDRVSKLALICTSARLLPRLRIVGGIIGAMRYLIPYGMFARTVMGLRVCRSSEEVNRGLGRGTLAPKHVAYACGRRLITDYDVRHRVSQVRAPTLIVAGEKDRGAPVRMSQFLHAEIKGSKLEVIARCGHVPMIEKPEDLSSILRGFLGQPDAS